VRLVKFKQDYTSVYFNEEIPTTGISHIAMRVVKTNAHNICLGVTKEFRRKEMYTFQQKAAVSFKIVGGKNLYEGAKQSGEHFPEILEG
jgi:hypothetical protein